MFNKKKTVRYEECSHLTVFFFDPLEDCHLKPFR